MCLINAGLIGVAVANDIAALVLAYVLGTTVTKAVFKRLPVVGSVLRGELKNNLNKDRLLCYRDNVFSILSTLLIFDVGARVVNAAKENPEHGSEAFAHALKTNLHFLAGFVLNFIISTGMLSGALLHVSSCTCGAPSRVHLFSGTSTALWALHESMFLHIKNLSSTWRSFHQLVLALGCYVPFVCTVVGAVLSIADKADQQEAAKLLFVSRVLLPSFSCLLFLPISPRLGHTRTAGVGKCHRVSDRRSLRLWARCGPALSPLACCAAGHGFCCWVVLSGLLAPPQTVQTRVSY